MQLLNSKYNIKARNYHKPTPVNLKVVADSLLLSIPVVESVLLSSPEFPGKEWATWGWSSFCAIFKLISKFVSN